VKVLGLEPHPDEVLVALVGGDASANPTIIYYDSFATGEGSRAAGLSAIRTRVHGLITAEKPELVFVKPLEPEAVKPANRRNINLSWFQTAEVRGVVLEAAHSVGAVTELRGAASVSQTIGSRSGKEYVADNDYWTSSVNGSLKNKRYRPVILMAISGLKG
jgi:hypothetical protein